MKIYGAVIVGDEEFHNEEIATLNPSLGWAYGLHWKFAGDQFFEESNIFATHNGEEFIAEGRTALKDFLNWYKQTECVL